MKARNSLVVSCREREREKKAEDGENVFFKALANKLFMVQLSCSWPTFYQMDFMKN